MGRRDRNWRLPISDCRSIGKQEQCRNFDRKSEIGNESGGVFMTPLDLCEPLFQYVCRVNRSARKNIVYDIEQVRSEIRALLEDIRIKSASDRRLAAQFDPAGGKLLLVMMFFADFMIRSGSLSFA